MPGYIFHCERYGLQLLVKCFQFSVISHPYFTDPSKKGLLCTYVSPPMPNKKEKLCIIGGGGYLGSILAKELVHYGHQVVILDSKLNQERLPKGTDFVQVLQGDIRNVKDLEKVLKQCDGVFHLASYGMSGSEMLDHERMRNVNILGTENVISACRNCNVQRLVYASTVNVVFGGQEIFNGSEDLPYFPVKQHVDFYSQSKAIAERHVLLANKKQAQSKSKPGGDLRTCALRFSGIYGVGERRHLPRIAKIMKQGLFRVTYGRDSVSWTQYVNGENCAQALRRAYDGLALGSDYVAAGKTYFIADGDPVDSFKFWKPLSDAIGDYTQI